VDSVLRAIAIYAFLLVLFRLMGKRSMSQVTTFDFLILLVFSEATQQAILGEDFSITHAALVIATLLVLDRGSDYLSWRFPRFRRATESMPVILVANGQVLEEVLRKEHLSVEDVLTAARESQGLERLDQIKWAVLETSGGISIVPMIHSAR
jgi:uncharacterized membrane protein YcaP (DUF421 family)